MFNSLYKGMGILLRGIYDLVMKIHPQDALMVSNYAIALIIFSILLKLATIPLTIKQNKSMANMQALQPKIKELEKKYGNDQQTIARKQQELMLEEGVNPMSGCLPLLVQLPILMAMFRVVREPINYVFTEPGLYESINKSFLWIKDINQVDTTMIMALIAAGSTFLYSHFMTPQNTAAAGDKEQQVAMESSQKMMKFMMPAIMFIAYRSWPAALPLYVTINMLATVIQQLIVNRIAKDEVE